MPGLSAASVWMTSSITRPDWVGSDRPSALTIPAVTLPASPSGLPSATTTCPTLSRDASPSSTGGGHGTARAQHGEVGERIPADHLDPGGRAVGEGRLARVGAGDHVSAGQQEAVGRDDAGAAGARRRAACDT